PEDERGGDQQARQRGDPAGEPRVLVTLLGRVEGREEDLRAFRSENGAGPDVGRGQAFEAGLAKELDVAGDAPLRLRARQTGIEGRKIQLQVPSHTLDRSGAEIGGR